MVWTHVSFAVSLSDVVWINAHRTALTRTHIRLQSIADLLNLSLTGALQNGLCPKHHLSLSCLRLQSCRCANGKYAQKLLKDLFANYSSALRPVEDTNKVLNVTLQVTLSQIIDMDERNQILTAYLWIRRVWVDAHLRWDKDEYDGLDTIRIPSSYVWRPDIVLYNNADDHFTGPMDTNVVIQHDGQITWDSPAITKSSCKVDVSFFPFDAQQCRFTYGSWTYNGNQLDILNGMDSADLADLVENVEWEVLGMPAKKNVIVYGCCAEPYPDKVSLGVTVMLALTVFQLLVAEIMPPSENVPLIGKYYIATMTMITASTALTIFIMNIHHCGPDAKPVPKWAKTIILQYLARMCFVYEVGENCMSPTPEKPDHPPGGCGPRGVSDHADKREPCCSGQCAETQLLRNMEYMANCYREQRATQKRTGEWKKVAKVLDRFFMWLFFIMVFLMSLLIMGKAI
uniref:Neurotransmitter-gated ion-channel ligand-binding domain-containing protein n=1 Tax=Periophthalmus magnuspinnatus TaxID=409849 RepID=A0A3B4A5T2_9GOBI